MKKLLAILVIMCLAFNLNVFAQTTVASQETPEINPNTTAYTFSEFISIANIKTASNPLYHSTLKELYGTTSVNPRNEKESLLFDKYFKNLVIYEQPEMADDIDQNVRKDAITNNKFLHRFSFGNSSVNINIIIFADYAEIGIEDINVFPSVHRIKYGILNDYDELKRNSTQFFEEILELRNRTEDDIIYNNSGIEQSGTCDLSGEVLFEADFTIPLSSANKNMDLYALADENGILAGKLTYREGMGDKAVVTLGDKTYLSYLRWVDALIRPYEYDYIYTNYGAAVCYYELNGNEYTALSENEVYSLRFEWTEDGKMTDPTFVADCKNPVDDSDSFEFIPTIVSQSGSMDVMLDAMGVVTEEDVQKEIDALGGSADFMKPENEGSEDIETENFFSDADRASDAECYFDFGARFETTLEDIPPMLIDATSDGKIEISLVELMKTGFGGAQVGHLLIRVKGNKGTLWYESTGGFPLEVTQDIFLTFARIEKVERFTVSRRIKSRYTVGVWLNFNDNELNDLSSIGFEFGASGKTMLDATVQIGSFKDTNLGKAIWSTVERSGN